METQQVLGNRYELRRRIGVGGMAVVYLAHDLRLDRDVAIKVLDVATTADPTFVERFRREARAAAAINHPNVIAVYDWGEAGSDAPATAHLYYLVMEYIPGPNLKEVIRERGPLPEDEALSIAAQVASALEAAHARSLVHRDIKSQNVLIGPDGRVKVADFGIAYLEGLTHLTRTNAVSGTAHYISPEQAQGKRVDARTDLYSLGVVLYEMVTGRVPFEGDSLVDVALHHVQETPIPPRRLRPDISPATETVTLRALAKDPSARYASAGEMRTAIENAMQAAERTAPALLVEEVKREPPSNRQTVSRAGADRTVRLDRSVPGPRPRARSEERRVSPWLMALPLLFLLLAGSALALRARSGSGTAAPPVTHRHTTPVPTATTRPARARPTSPPATAIPTTAPTSPPRQAQPTTPPAHGVVPPRTQPQPTATSGLASSSPNGGAGSPQDAVSGFYNAISQHDWGTATSYWTSAMQGRCPPQECINNRFVTTHNLNLTITGVNRQGNAATVGIDLIEGKADGSTIHWVGSWNLVHEPSGWQLDSVNLNQAQSGGGSPPAPPGNRGDNQSKHKGNDKGQGNGNG
ncbi:MAG TPA: protein kinase [Chloroflexota bacterium]